MEQLGMEPKLLLAQLVNFAIIVFVLTKLLYKPMLSMLEKRKKEIAQGLLLTEKMKEEEAKWNVRKEKLMDEARKAARTVVDDAKKEAEAVKKDIIADAHKEAGVVIEKGKVESQALKVRMEKDVRHAAVSLAVAMSRQLLSDVLSEKDQHALIQKHVKSLEHMRV